MPKSLASDGPTRTQRKGCGYARERELEAGMGGCGGLSGAAAEAEGDGTGDLLLPDAALAPSGIAAGDGDEEDAGGRRAEERI